VRWMVFFMDKWGTGLVVDRCPTCVVVQPPVLRVRVARSGGGGMT